jgi:hypothetical protein
MFSTHSSDQAPSSEVKECDPVSDGYFSGAPNYAVARAARELCEAELRKLDLEERKGNLLSRRAVEIETFKLFRVLRDTILNIPSRISAQLAVESDPRNVEEVLETELRRALESFRRQEPIEDADAPAMAK